MLIGICLFHDIYYYFILSINLLQLDISQLLINGTDVFFPYKLNFFSMKRSSVDIMLHKPNVYCKSGILTSAFCIKQYIVQYICASTTFAANGHSYLQIRLCVTCNFTIFSNFSHNNDRAQ